MTEQNGISFNPADASVGGQLNDVDATVVSSAIVSFDFNGKTDDGEPRTCWAIGYKADDAEGDDVSMDYISLGKLDQFTASPDGKRAIPVGSKTQLHKNSKAMTYARSLIENGFPANQLGNDVSVIVGLHVHLSAIAMPSFKGKDGKETSGKVTLVTKIHDKPAAGGAVKGAKPAATAAKQTSVKAAPTTTAAPAGDAAEDGIDLDGKAAEFIFNAIAEGGGKLQKSTLPGKAFKAFSDTAVRNAVVRAINNAAWLGGEGRPWKLNGGELVVE